MTAPTPDPTPIWSDERIDSAAMYYWNYSTYYEAARSALRQMRKEYEKHIAAQAARIEELEKSLAFEVHCFETLSADQNRMMDEIERLRAELAAAQQEAMPVPDWSSAPEWANWWAANAGKTIGWYELKPIIITGDPYWSEQHGRKLHANMLTDLPIGIDWRKTLVARPSAQPKQGGGDA